MTSHILEMRKLGQRAVTSFGFNPGVPGFYKPYTSVLFFDLLPFSPERKQGDGRCEKHALLVKEGEIR